MSNILPTTPPTRRGGPPCSRGCAAAVPTATPSTRDIVSAPQVPTTVATDAVVPVTAFSAIPPSASLLPSPLPPMLPLPFLCGDPQANAASPLRLLNRKISDATGKSEEDAFEQTAHRCTLYVDEDLLWRTHRAIALRRDPCVPVRMLGHMRLRVRMRVCVYAYA